MPGTNPTIDGAGAPEVAMASSWYGRWIGDASLKVVLPLVAGSFIGLAQAMGAINEDLHGVALVLICTAGALGACVAYLSVVNVRLVAGLTSCAVVVLAVAGPAVARSGHPPSGGQLSDGTTSTAGVVTQNGLEHPSTSAATSSSTSTSTSTSTSMVPTLGSGAERVVFSDSFGGGPSSRDVLGGRVVAVLGGINFDEHPVTGGLTHLVTMSLIDNSDSGHKTELVRSPRGTRRYFGKICQYEVIIVGSDTFTATLEFRELITPVASPPSCDDP